MEWKISELPLLRDIETKPVLKSLPAAHAALAELKGIAASMLNQNILINTLGLQEAKDSSAIENIITTHDDLYRDGINPYIVKSLEAKEVQSYVSALKLGCNLINQEGLLTARTILKVQEELEKNSAGYRKLPGTELKNERTGETIYIPPQHYDDIVRLMTNLEGYMNDQFSVDLDPIINMAIIHYQFETIHPFYDGNGRTGRILNLLYLIDKGLLHVPILYLSGYIIRNKAEYYRLLQNIRLHDDWESWLLFIIHAVQATAKETIDLVIQIRDLMMNFKHLLRANYKFYSQDLLNNLFMHPYTKIEFVVKDLGVTRLTAANYLNRLAYDGVLRKEKLGPGNYYINEPLFDVLSAR